MRGRSTTLTDPSKTSGDPRVFTFDHSYWSHNGYTVGDAGYIKAADEKYVDQKRLFADLGPEMIANAWAGYNCTLFAYGQTGSGKSYTMMGHGQNKGMIPQLCEKLFTDIAEKRTPGGGVYFQVSFSMLEIYNEKVRDLLNNDKQPSQGLPVRLSPTHGFFVEGLKSVPVAYYRDIEYHIEEGNKNRTLAATKMNECSSRAHTIVQINFDQNSIRENRTRQSKIFLVDLAGSERASQTGATGVRFEESKSINKSLMTLGTVIKNLCAVASGRTDQGPAPHRDSKLTMLLKDAIGGNSKTYMMATISPSDESYEQTLSTLRYADRVKSIRNAATMNVADTDTLIKTMLAEKEELLSLLRRNGDGRMGYTEEEVKMMREKQITEIESIKAEMGDLQCHWQKRLQDSNQKMTAQIEEEHKKEIERENTPHLWNLNEEPSLSRKLYYLIKQGSSVSVGNGRAKPAAEIELHGPSIVQEHAVLHNRSGHVTITTLHGDVKVNGQSTTAKTTLNHQDRVFFGGNNILVFYHPLHKERLKKEGTVEKKVTYAQAQKEIAKCEKLLLNEGEDWLKQEVAETLLMTHDANAMAYELGREVTFDPVVVPKMVLGEGSHRSQVYVRVKVGNGGEFIWGRNTFIDRFDLMSDMFQKYESGHASWEPKSQTQDPFWEPLESPTLIGVAYVPLECIAYMLDIENQQIGIYDYQARHVGYLGVALVPCNDALHECGEDKAVEEPAELLGQSIAFKLTIKGATGIPRRFKSSWCHYTFHNEQTRLYTEEVAGVVPKYNFEHIHMIPEVTEKVVEFLESESIMVEIYGRQQCTSPTASRRGSTLAVYSMADRRRMSNMSNLLLDVSRLGGRRGSINTRDSSTSSPPKSEITSDAHGSIADTTDYLQADTVGTEADESKSTITSNVSSLRSRSEMTSDAHVAITDTTDYIQEDTVGTDADESKSSVSNAVTSYVTESTEVQNSDADCTKVKPLTIIQEIQRGIGMVIDSVMANYEMGADGTSTSQNNDCVANVADNTNNGMLNGIMMANASELKEANRSLVRANEKLERIRHVVHHGRYNLSVEVKRILEET